MQKIVCRLYAKEEKHFPSRFIAERPKPHSLCLRGTVRRAYNRSAVSTNRLFIETNYPIGRWGKCHLSTLNLETGQSTILKVRK